MEDTAEQAQEKEKEEAVEKALGLNEPTAEEKRELDAALDVIRQGESPTWRQTFSHPIHGDLEVIAKLPTAGKMARHSLAMDEFARDAGIARSMASATYLASIAAFDVLFEQIVLDERREEDPEDPDHTKLVKVYYSAANDVSEHFPLDAWLAFSRFRGRLLDRLGDLKNSSAGTTGAESGESLPAPTESRSMTPA